MKEDSKKELTPEEKELVKRGMAAGGILTGAGLAGLGLASHANSINKKLASEGRVLIPEGVIKNGKLVGAASLIVGTPVLGYTVYKHYKNKKDEKK